ncbi:MAG: DNA cytosine methyltransferase [Dehalococcoidia bacterium]|nr:DNA cytosine methyltransferase [Dehalococcoidia bacterium]
MFKPVLSIEKDPWAHGTLRLRALFRHLSDRSKIALYYEYVRGAIQMNELLAACPEEAALADQEAWLAELGPPNHNEVAARVREVIAGQPRWVLIGGPPCQAYSLVGRSRMRGVDPARFEADHRHLLYREYLKLLAEHAPTAFVMENVKGLLSATHASKPIFRRILDDLVSPGLALGMDHTMHQYQLVAISPDGPDDQMGAMRPQDFILRSEDFGVPQARHRVIIVGFRRDLLHEGFTVARLQKRSPVPIEDVLSDAPRLRSGVSPVDSFEAWSAALSEGEKLIAIEAGDVAAALRFTEKLARPPGRGGQFVAGSPAPQYRTDWYADPLIGGFLNHESRSHMTTDLHRYLFLSAHALLTGRSPTLKDFPEKLLPDHANVDRALKRGLFNDRFRVQRYGRPSSTITSHMSKDGHHFIHPDPSQCRSLTVREAARLQTFPDNYFFEGPRTSQYVQVGNAVPPLLSLQIAETLGRALDTLG